MAACTSPAYRANACSWADLAVASKDDSKRPEGMEPGLAHELDFDEGAPTFPFGSHVAVVEVDRETGQVDLVRHVAVDDCGRILNPLLVNGQQHGGIAQGIAQALFEEVSYDEDGNPLTGTLVDYSMPSAAELPSFEVSNTETASPPQPARREGPSASRAPSARRLRWHKRRLRRRRPPGHHSHRHALHTPERVEGAAERVSFGPGNAGF